MRLDLIEHGHCECLDFGDDVATLVASFIDTGAFEANTPAEQLTAFFAISDEGIDSEHSGPLKAIIRYRMPSGHNAPLGSQEWPDMIVDTFGPIERQEVYRRVDNGPDEVYGVKRLA